MAKTQHSAFGPSPQPLAPSPWFLAALLLILALLPRLWNLADFVTTDEAYHWVDRVAGFGAALAAGRWRETILTGHPGVTAMWLGWLGSWLESLWGPGWPGAPTAPPEVAHLAWLRLPHALLESLAVPVAFLLLRKLVRPTTALLAALLWAASPFLIAHGRLLHLDGLLTLFVTFSLLLLLAAHGPAGYRLRLVAASGVCAGLALLTKGPALILVLAAALVFLVDGRAVAVALARRRVIPAALLLVRAGVLWLAAALLTVLLLWPALWVAPGAALGRYVSEIVSNGGRANGDGQFFLGRAVEDPGPLFYPLASLLRTTPLMLAGLILLPLALRSARERRSLLLLLGFVLLWGLVMTLGPKKFDRYLLPAWPALLVLSAAGWATLFELVGRLRLGSLRTAALPLLLLAFALGEGIQPFAAAPYFLSYYNPLLGGGSTAEATLLVGWGEGMDQVGSYLRSRPDIGGGPVLSALGRTLQPFVPVTVRDVLEYGRTPANYAVVYRESLQRAADPPLYAQIQQTLPLHEVRIAGISYALIYQLPRPFARPVGAQFAQALLLRGVTVEQRPDAVIVTPAWDVRARPAASYTLFVHLIDDQGRTVARADVPPGGAGPATDAWQPGEQIAVPVPLPNQPPGTYRVVLGLYDGAGQRLPFTGGTAADPALDGPNALLADTIIVGR